MGAASFTVERSALRREKGAAVRTSSVLIPTVGCIQPGRAEQTVLLPEEDRREAEKYTACDLLILDDLGTEMGGQFVTAALYSLINDRMLAGKATIISTNLTVDELSRRYNPQIASRLRGSYTRVAFLGDDIRVVRNRGM